MGEQGRAAIFEAFHQLMLDFSRDRRVIFFMDDAHWCDQSSLDVLGYLQKRGFFEQHGLLLLAARVEEKDPMLESFLDNQPRSHLIRSFTLDQFGYSDVLQMADHLLGFTPSEAFAQRLLLDTGGNPLFLLETLHTLQKLGLDSDQINAARNLPVAGSIRILIRNRLNQLNDETRELLNTAAVMGNSFSIPILKKACPTKNMDFVLAIEELERVHLIQPAVNEFTGGKYSFIHEKIRESLLQDISQVRVKLLHDRVATAMEETGPTSQQAAVIAEHYQTAGNIHKAFHFWIEAGQYACFMLSPQEASRAFQNVEKLFLQTEVLLDIKEIHKLYILWAGLLEERNDTPGLANCYNKLIEWGRKRQAPLLVGSGYVGLSHLEILKVNPQRAMEYIQEAEIYLAQVDDKFETSKLYNQKGMIFQLSSNLDEAADAYQKSLQLTEGMLDQQILNSRAQLLTRLAMLGIFLCNTQIAMDTALENVRLGNQIGNHLATGWGYTMQTTAHYMVAEYEKGINAARSGIQVAGLIQNQHMLAYLNAGLGKNELDLGRLKDGWDHLNQSISLATEYKHFEVVSEAYVGLAEVYMDLRNFRKAYQIASEGTVCHQNNYQMFQNLLQCGLSHLLLGELDEGISKVNQVLTFAGKAGLNYIFYPALVCEAYLDIARGDMDSARTTLNIILEFCVPRNLLSQVYMCYWLLSSIARLKGDSRAALDLARKAGSLAKRMQNPWLEINILQMIAQMEKELKNDFSYERNRIQTLLTSISAGGIPPELQEDFNSFLQQIQIN
jgi:tetratricopeptide (TPR) repeat protein